MGIAPAYHHENLRETLLAAAVELIGEVGPRAFTLREVARRAGVSHNAPYRHFQSKAELLTAVAIEGFARMTAVMKRSAGKGKTAADRLKLCGCGYVDFAMRFPHHFLVMFDLSKEETGACVEPVGKNAFDVLMGCILDAQQAGQLPKVDPLPQAWTAWSLVHGIAKLAVSGNLPLTHAATLEFTRAATDALSGGMMKQHAPLKH